ncbi:bifunctional tRNA pseudouridine(32) synthase/23S rRNA pseudouridine(746) synthase RluA [Photobacterium sp. WH77]|uniref:bifunctional tRNA pseudouridine(32) synthase/23S rRNA pseudouridine(746) synthase RluA n=1 Tax=unclassified Photobacterium TaxID=2628852 RepID=UPI001C47CA04|nr:MULTISPECIES: bifunctional tRNA pseudouridine(32) synthase/23S rRNA pseudouridine(746) synthase RluA [unclassified Photobacterium]MBV7261285.1 bifunctional tRNA pseudouridine(32) synthase/23S rRNA pseudouridine(746) synthase RluA [Photobacterium sp. WH24]MCG2835285.1 bifunctional tRNA pseudouridine(32) synthase/23S rRNA pseudouridine(746) synthase RluA [Photobacterium sp. WH77]MCG2842898.1 bifunctional tRNA pseudouridine(32) synthase/23S rRNA pseudouridine(746) synthase RluA [Photobacterium s
MNPLPPLDYNPPADPWLDVLYVDRDIIAVNKPSGLLSNPGRDPAHADSVFNRVLAEHPKAQIVHRLDMATSGLIILSLNKDAERHLKAQFRDRQTEKVYYARVWGTPEQLSGTIDLPLICDWPNRPMQKVCFEHGKPSVTHYEVIASDGQSSLVRLRPVTGRSHQLRVHMLALGHPILGDGFYAHDQAKALAPRLQLHAAELSFFHPYSNEARHVFAPCEFYPDAPERTL